MSTAVLPSSIPSTPRGHSISSPSSRRRATLQRAPSQRGRKLRARSLHSRRSPHTPGMRRSLSSTIRPSGTQRTTRQDILTSAGHGSSRTLLQPARRFGSSRSISRTSSTQLPIRARSSQMRSPMRQPRPASPRPMWCLRAIGTNFNGKTTTAASRSTNPTAACRRARGWPGCGIHTLAAARATWSPTTPLRAAQSGGPNAPRNPTRLGASRCVLHRHRHRLDGTRMPGLRECVWLDIVHVYSLTISSRQTASASGRLHILCPTATRALRRLVRIRRAPARTRRPIFHLRTRARGIEGGSSSWKCRRASLAHV